MRIYLMFLACCWTLAGATPAAFAAPVLIQAGQASAAPRSDVGTGVCATAVHLTSYNTLTSPAVAQFYLSQSPGMSNVDDKISFSPSTVNFHNSDPAATTDYPNPLPLPFTPIPAAPKGGNGDNLAMRLRGYVKITHAGIYTFGVYADDGYSLSLAGTPIMQSSQTNASLRDSQQVQFAAPGLYALELIYFQKSGPALLDLAKSEAADVEVRSAPGALPSTFKLVDQTELYSALAGQSNCSECANDAACVAGSGNYCRDGLCQRCIIPTHCGASCSACSGNLPACSGSECVECTGADTSYCAAKGQICDSNRCVACSSDVQCGTGKVCDLAFGQCIPRPQGQYGGGCSMSRRDAPQGLGLALLLLGGLAALHRLRRRRSRPLVEQAVVSAVCFACLGSAAAQTTAAAAPTVSFNAQTFRPAIGPGNVFTVEGTLMPRHPWPMGAVLFEYANRPLRFVLQGSGETYAATVPAMLTAHLMPGVGITRWLAVGLDVPVVLYQGFDNRTPISDAPNIPSAAGIGDLRLVTKLRLLNNEEGGFGLAFVPQFTFPTGKASDFRGEDTVGIEPRVAADYRLKRGVFIAVNLGYWVRTYNRTVDFDLVRVSDQLRYGLGIGVPLVKGFGVAGELSGAVSFSKFDGGSFYTPLEGYLGARYTHKTGVELTAGGGAGFINAVGSPNFRVFAGIGYVPTGKKAVRSSIEEEPERRVAGGADADQDGVADRVDACPQEPGPLANRGCPEVDTDKDGIVDRLDKCPDKAGPPDSAGCPVAASTADTDKDGVPDAQDKCPAAAGPAENGGCPDIDTDKDGVVDRLDKCPDKAGPPDSAGCPMLEIGEASIRLRQPIKFQAGSAKLEDRSGPVVTALGKAVSADPAIKKVRIEVQASGDKKAAKKLARQRVKVLAAALISADVGKKFLQIKAAKTPGSDEINEVELVKGKVKVKKEHKSHRHRKAAGADEEEEGAPKEKKAHHHRHHRKAG